MRRKPGSGHSGGLLLAGDVVTPCLLGKTGISHNKHEGDGATPSGSYELLFGFFRSDRISPPSTLLPMRALTPQDGWCDAPNHPAYNRPVRLPFAASHENLWRDDRLYDICLVMDHNFSRRHRNRGSAVFVHLTADKPYTAGCIALSPMAMIRLLPFLRNGTRVEISL
ncbi:L,D-transpeptidase family protein [Salaquimonas pukyongi]|uniref:L,D-transpeptidase family protein n=1 Tax=Salaquimonas pukyongi TaxID=2712698 RepID=UPI00096BC28D|nr:L,D-transpeptidase family protein [Salaquimonas pukyongi]